MAFFLAIPAAAKGSHEEPMHKSKSMGHGHCKPEETGEYK